MTRLSVLGRGLLVSAAVIVVGLAPATVASASTPGQLDSGATLGSGATLFSSGGNVALTMQTDGNLVLYAPGHVAIWATGTNGRNGAILAEQSDGNLVVIAPGNNPVWASGTGGHPGAVLQVQDDGNMVQYAPGHAAIWSTGTSTGTSAIGALATANQGRRACDRNSLGGTGYYTSCTGGPENWCADFAKWVWAHSGFNVTGLTNGAISFYPYGQRFGTTHPSGYTPHVGDAIVYDMNSAHTSASHVGIVTGVSNGVIHTENGNFGGGGNPSKSVVTPEDLPASASIGYHTSFGKMISAIVSPVK